MAAGLGFKTFTTGEVLTAADTNGYLMQGVLVFASAAARDAAITSPQEGQCCYLKDTDAVLTYSGAAWVGFDDSNAIQNTIVDAKGDIVAASGSDTPARLAVGNNGETLVADSSTSTGLRYKEDYAAGKNKIINGDFAINQRAFSSTTTSLVFMFDRWVQFLANGTVTYSAQTFTPGTAPVAGYEGKNFIRCVTSGQTLSSAASILIQRIEDVRTLAGQTATISFWAKANTGTPKIAIEFDQDFGTGGSPSTAVKTYAGQATLSTSWQRYSVSVSVPSISGKTIGTTDPGFLALYLWTSAGTDFNARTGSLGIQSNTFDIWGVQVEESSVATAFQTATGTLQGELAACQRYFFLEGFGKSVAQRIIGAGGYVAAGDANCVLHFPVTMRTTPTLIIATGATNYAFSSAGNALDYVSSLTIINSSPTTALLYNATETSGTAGQAAICLVVNNPGSIGFSAEL